MISKKFRNENTPHFLAIADIIDSSSNEAESIQEGVKGYMGREVLKFGAIFPLLRIFITGSMQGPDLFEMISLIGNQECAQRVRNGLNFAKTLIGNV